MVVFAAGAEPAELVGDVAILAAVRGCGAVCGVRVTSAELAAAVPLLRGGSGEEQDAEKKDRARRSVLAVALWGDGSQLAALREGVRSECDQSAVAAALARVLAGAVDFAPPRISVAERSVSLGSARQRRRAKRKIEASAK